MCAYYLLNIYSLHIVKKVILDIDDMVSKNNFDHYLLPKKIINIVNIYFYKTTFQDESTYIAFIFSNSI